SPLSSHRLRPPLPPHSFPTRRSSDLVLPRGLKVRDRQWLHRGRPIGDREVVAQVGLVGAEALHRVLPPQPRERPLHLVPRFLPRSEEHTSELQSRFDLVCRLLLEKKK